MLRIEDTDLERSTEEAIQQILDGMEWAGLAHDEGPFYQTKRFDRYKEVIEDMLASGHAYRCYCTKEELAELRADQMARGEKPRYDGRWRDRTDARAGRRTGGAIQESSRWRGGGRRCRPWPGRVPECGARRPHHCALGWNADLQLLRGRGRHGHADHACDPRRRSLEQHAAADEHAASARAVSPRPTLICP